MSTTTIGVAEECGPNLSSASLGKQLRARVVGVVLAQGEATLDFSGVVAASDSFIEELFIGLGREWGTAWFNRHVRVTHLSPELNSAVRAVLTLAATSKVRAPGERRMPSHL